MKIADGETLLFTGDSITDCGRHRPLGTGAGLGDGYVAFTDRLVAECYQKISTLISFMKIIIPITIVSIIAVIGFAIFFFNGFCTFLI